MMVDRSFWDADNNDDHFASAGDLLRHWFDDKAPLTDEALWMRIQDVNRHPFDPLRIVAVDYRPWERKHIYYSDHMGLISHPRFSVMQHILPWYWRFTVKNLTRYMECYNNRKLVDIILRAETNWFELPLNAKFLANLNVWRTAIAVKSIPARQQLLFN